MCLQGHAGQLRSFFILFTQNERCMLSPPRARPSHWAQNPLTRTEQGSTGQPLIRMTKLYCFHTNTWSNQNTHLTGHTAAHIHKKKKMRKALFLSPISLFLLLCGSHTHEYTEVQALFSLKFTSTQELRKGFGIYCALFSMTSEQPLTLTTSVFELALKLLIKYILKSLMCGVCIWSRHLNPACWYCHVTYCSPSLTTPAPTFGKVNYNFEKKGGTKS